MQRSITATSTDAALISEHNLMHCNDLHGCSFSQFDLHHSVTKAGPEACDLHAICLLTLKFVSVSMTMDKSYVVHLS